MILADWEPKDPAGWCAPHLVQGQMVHASTQVNGTSMCTAHAVANLTPSSSTTSPSTAGTGSGTGIVITL